VLDRLFGFWMYDCSGLLLFGLKYAEPAQFHGFAVRQAGHDFIEVGLEDRRLADGQAMLPDNCFYKIGFLHRYQRIAIHFWISVERSDAEPVTAVMTAFTSANRVFENREDTLWGGVRGTSRRTCAGANGRVSEISYNR
jgi:hypothetical protein